MVITNSIKDGVVVTIEIPAIDIVYIAIAIIVNPIASDFSRISTCIGGQITMSIHIPFIDNAYIHTCRPCVVCCPGFTSLATILIRRSSRIAVHAPKRSIGIIQIVRCSRMMVNKIRLRKLNTFCAFQIGNGFQHILIYFHQQYAFLLAGLFHDFGQNFFGGFTLYFIQRFLLHVSRRSLCKLNN